MTDWVAWHAEYEDPDSRLAQRLREVQRQLTAMIDRAPDGPIRIISACGGQGRDVIPVVADHARRDDITARVVEFDAALAADARAGAPANIEVVTGDATNTSAFEGAVPANIAVFCGIFGNVTDDDIRHTINVLPSLLAPNGEVIWTRHTAAPDLSPTIRGWFEEAGFDELAYVTSPTLFGVGTHRLAKTPTLFEPGVTMFQFVR